MKSPNHFRYFLTSAALLAGLTAKAQVASRPVNPPAQIERRADGTPELVRFDVANAPAAAEAPSALRTALALGSQSELRPVRAAEIDELGFTHQRYQQYYQGVPVEFTAYTTHSRAGVVEYMTGETRPIADGALQVQPSLSAEAALRAALAFVHADKYQWEMPGEGQFAQETEGKSTFRPTGELVIVDNILSMDRKRVGVPVLAWKFNIYAAQPVSRAWIYVDAKTGEIVNQDAIIKHVTATFTTKYSGTRSLVNSQTTFFSLYQLKDYSRGQGIETYNLNKGNNLGAATNFLDSNNIWSAAEYNNANQDWVAGDALFGAQQTYDYWLSVHNRNSFNGAGALIKSYVHYDDTPGDGMGLDNAFWNGAVMLYGDGYAKFRQLATVDVCGHEIGHAVCDNTSALQYQDESGAMTEGFSDIWGACVEARAAGLFGLPGKNTWLIGEEIALLKPALRSMSDPKSLGQPDTYQGTNWYAGGTWDHGGVHTNSGVLNHWFYLLSQGGSGTNDKGNAYTVTGVGITKAAKIAYLTEKLLSSTSNYAAGRTMAIQAATTLYGATSAEVRSVKNAWYAVGIGNGVAYGATGSRYIDAVALNGLARFSGNDNGYFDGVGAGLTVPVLNRCAQQTMVLSAGFVGAVGNQYWNVYIDLNHDNDFNDTGERVVNNKLITTDAWNAAMFSLPATANLGNARMRVIMTAAATALTNGFIGTGEVEDYTVTVAAATAVGLPTNLAATAITATSATLQWSSTTGAASYNVQYRVNTSLVWTTVATATNTKSIGGLQGGRTYYFRTQAVNGCGTLGAYTAVATFSTPAVRPMGTEPEATAGALATAAATAYPNPATDVLHLAFDQTPDQDAADAVPTTVEIYDLRGTRVQSAAYDGRGTLNVSALAPGLYTATLRGANSIGRVRFVKE